MTGEVWIPCSRVLCYARTGSAVAASLCGAGGARRRSRAPRARKWGHLQILYIYTTYTYTCIISVYSYVIYLYTLNYDLTGA